MSELKRRLESVLFASGKRLTTEELSKLVRERDVERIKQALYELKSDLEKKDSSIMLIEEGDSWKLQVREGYLPFVSKIVTQTELSKTILETLAVIAFKAPVLQSNVVKIRTNKAYRHLDDLEERGYITREKKGRTKLIKLTQKFFEYFDIPPQALKDKFKGYKALEKVIEKKEEQIEEAQAKALPPEKVKTEEGELETFGVIEKYSEEITPPLEEAKTTVGELEVYGEPVHLHGEPKETKKPKKRKRKPKKEAEVPEEAAETPVEEPEAPPEKVEEKEEPAEEAPIEEPVEEAPEEPEEKPEEKPPAEKPKEETPPEKPEEKPAEPPKKEEKPEPAPEPEEKPPEVPWTTETEEKVEEPEPEKPAPKTREEEILQKAEDIVYPGGKPEIIGELAGKAKVEEEEEKPAKEEKKEEPKEEEPEVPEEPSEEEK